jgi:elongation factor P
MNASSLRQGNIIIFRGELHQVFSMIHRTPGNLRAFVQAKLRNLNSGSIIDHRFSATEQVERAVLEQHEMEYLFEDGGKYTFMNTEDYEQIELTSEFIGDAANYLLPNTTVTVEFHEGKPIGIDLPDRVTLTVVETEPGIKSATASSVNKPAKMATGITVQVPPFINEGEKIVVSTNDGSYISRAN